MGCFRTQDTPASSASSAGRRNEQGNTVSRKNVFVVGLDPFNLEKLRAVHDPDSYRLIELLAYRDVQHEGNYPFEEPLAKARQRLAEHEGPIDAIIGYWDFPVTPIVSILCEDHGLPGASLESVLRCEHKYWSRLEQQKVVPECVPGFDVVDPFDDAAIAQLHIGFPFWLKPVKAFSSQLGFRIESPADFQQAIRTIRTEIDRFARPFDEALARIELPPEVRHVDGRHCIAEQIIGGHQCTVEGYAHQGSIEVYGIVDSLREPGMSCFSRYQYPSQLPEPVKARMTEVSTRVMRRFGYDDATFNVEFFWDEGTDKLWLLEVNPRLSQSHSAIFHKVDGVSNFDKMLRVALGRRPLPMRQHGRFRIAAKFFLRRFRDARVERVPSQRELRQIRLRVPGTLVQVVPEEGRLLSEMQNQDSYSYELALVHVGANSETELERKYQQVVSLLHFELSEVGPSKVA